MPHNHTRPADLPDPPAITFRELTLSVTPSAQRILAVAESDVASRGGLTGALGRVLSVIPEVTAALYEALPPDQFRNFQSALLRGLRDITAIVGSGNPGVALTAALEVAQPHAEHLRERLARATVASPAAHKA